MRQPFKKRFGLRLDEWKALAAMIFVPWLVVGVFFWAVKLLIWIGVIS